MTPADPTGALFDQVTSYLVTLADEVGYQVELADLDPVCGIHTRHVLDWVKAGARHATLAYQRHLLAVPIAFLKQDTDGGLDHALADLLWQDRWLDQAQDATRRQYATACAILSRHRLGLIWPYPESTYIDTSAAATAVPAPDHTPARPTDRLETHEPTTDPTSHETETDHGHSR